MVEQSTGTAHLALYGLVGIKREWCSTCEGFSLVVEGCLSCCGKDSEVQPSSVKRMSNPDGKRSLSWGAKKAIMASQNHRCAYCGKEFGSRVFKKTRPVFLRAEFDHAMPYAYVRGTTSDNIVVACHVCNHLKSDGVFDSHEAAVVWIAAQREAKGYNF